MFRLTGYQTPNRVWRLYRLTRANSCAAWLHMLPIRRLIRFHDSRELLTFIFEMYRILPLSEQLGLSASEVPL